MPDVDDMGLEAALAFKAMLNIAQMVGDRAGKDREERQKQIEHRLKVLRETQEKQREARKKALEHIKTRGIEHDPRWLKEPAKEMSHAYERVEFMQGKAVEQEIAITQAQGFQYDVAADRAREAGVNLTKSTGQNVGMHAEDIASNFERAREAQSLTKNAFATQMPQAMVVEAARTQELLLSAGREVGARDLAAKAISRSAGLGR